MKKWIQREIARGLQGLIALRLPGAPGEDTVSLTLDVWCAALEPRGAGWHEAPDAERIRRAFGALFLRCRQWPAPAELLDALPPPEPVQLLPAPKFSAEEVAANRARIQALMDRFFKHHSMR
jgi:hypothetical protein